MKGLLLSMLFVVGLLLPGIASAQTRTITGRVMDESGSPLTGASVQAQGRGNVGTTTGADGRFSLTMSSTTTAVVVSYVGMGNERVPITSDRSAYDITLFSESIEMGEVVIQAGILTREVATFTGSVKQVTQAELKEAGTLNALTALSTIDPSFNIVVDNLLGSDPNALPNIEINGKTSLDISSATDEYQVNPNIPLFVIDGFESTLEKVNDLDINRIASMTLLKDAGSTAIYGAKGANGVVVVETIKPKVGELMVNYSLNASVSFADLGSYNLMNAKEKLEFELLSGYYDQAAGTASYIPYDGPGNTSNYYDKLELVQRGIDTYWLKYPVRTGLSHQHYFSVSGGEGNLRYSAQMGYNNKVGVMKGSNHETINGNVFLQYRTDNGLNVSNDISFGTTNSHTGSYGSFKTWADMSPYYKPYDDDGELVPNVNTMRGGSFDAMFIANPLYNAKLGTDNMGKSIDFVNNTKFDYALADLGLRFYGGLSLRRSSGTSENYKDPKHTDFRDKVYTESGSYVYGASNNWSWSGNIAASIARTLGDSHNFNVLVRAQADNTKGWGSSYTAIGLPEGAKPNPSQAEQYAIGSRPSYSTSIRRGATFLGTFSYNYATRYLFDFTFNQDGSTTFGSKNPFTTNWSVGAGWNISREKFAENWTLINNLKLRSSYGTNANQNSNSITSSIYRYEAGLDYFGQAWTLASIANPYLEWQKVDKLSVGLDVSLLDSRLNLTFDIFDQKTNPLAIKMPEPPSAGADSGGYDINAGYVNSRGWNTSASYTIIRRPEDRMLFSARLSAAHSKQEYGGFGNAFKALNSQYADRLNDIDFIDERGNLKEEAVAEFLDILKNNTPFRQYRDGADPDALWAVKSLGIDPATGMEVFQDLDGNPVFAYDSQNRVQIATTRAKVHGSFGFTFNYKNFRSSLNFRYSLGGYAVNRALYERVENILDYAVLNNQDKRALYDRWQKPGDISEFKSIKRYRDGFHDPSSRFIQKNNYLEATAIQLGYDFSESSFVQKLSMKSLVLSVSMNDLFRFATIKQERGLDYPFARNVTFSLSTSF